MYTWIGIVTYDLPNKHRTFALLRVDSEDYDLALDLLQEKAEEVYKGKNAKVEVAYRQDEIF